VTTSASSIVALCRAGFEPECARDLQSLIDAAKGVVAAEPAIVPGVVALPLSRSLAPARMSAALVARPPIFARELSVGAGPIPLGERDRITPIVAAARALGVTCGTLWLEYPDTNDGKHLSSLCRRLEPLLRDALQSAQVLTTNENQLATQLPTQLPTLHVVFTSKQEAYVATSAPSWNSAWPMGIPRLKMPRDVPSRSTLKLAEAFSTF